MYTPLVPCVRCARHVRITDASCPFCGAEIVAGEAQSRIVPGTSRRMSRAAAFVFGATVAMGACESDVTVADQDGTTGAGTTGAGGKGGAGGAGGPTTAGPSGSGGDTSTSSAGEGGFFAEYGVPPPPVGAGGAAGAGGDGGAAVGGASSGDGGGAQPLYGVPPPDKGA